MKADPKDMLEGLSFLELKSLLDAGSARHDAMLADNLTEIAEELDALAMSKAGMSAKQVLRLKRREERKVLKAAKSDNTK